MTASKERRRSGRRPILETFAVFVTVPKKGPQRLTVHDVSEHGIGFDLDTDGEPHTGFPVDTGEKLQVHLYLNQSLYLELEGKITRLENKGKTRKLGVEFGDRDSASFRAYTAFLQLLDRIVEAVRLEV